MRILVLGSGLIGPASAYNAMLDPEVSQVTLCDLDQQKLDTAEAKLTRMEGAEKLRTIQLNVNDLAETVNLMAQHDAVVGALDRPAIGLGIRSGAHAVHFPGVGECEAWNEEFFPWLMDLEALTGLKSGTQMTVRWPGYAQKASVLWELDLVRTKAIDVDGLQVAPKDLLDALLYPHVRMEEEDRDITCFRVEALGQKKGRPRRYKIEMVDRYDEELGLTSMARTTGFAGAIVARMAARGEIKARGLFNPEKVIAGPLFERLVRDLAAMDIRFDMTVEKTKVLN